MTVEELAGRLGVTTQTLDRWIKAGVLPKPEVHEGQLRLRLGAGPAPAGRFVSAQSAGA